LRTSDSRTIIILIAIVLINAFFWLLAVQYPEIVSPMAFGDSHSCFDSDHSQVNIFDLELVVAARFHRRFRIRTVLRRPDSEMLQKQPVQLTSVLATDVFRYCLLIQEKHTLILSKLRPFMKAWVLRAFLDLFGFLLDFSLLGLDFFSAFSLGTQPSVPLQEPP